MNLDIFGKNKVADLKSEIALHGSTGTNTRAIDVARMATRHARMRAPRKQKAADLDKTAAEARATGFKKPRGVTPGGPNPYILAVVTSFGYASGRRR